MALGYRLRFLQVATVDPRALLYIVGGKGAARSVGRAVGKRAVDGHARKKYAGAARYAQAHDFFFAQSRYIKRVHGFVPAFAVAVAHGIGLFPRGMFTRIAHLFKAIEAFVVAAGHDAEPAVFRIGIAQRQPTGHERVRFVADIVRVLV